MLSAKTTFMLLNDKKANVPDGIAPKLLKTFTDQLGEVHTTIFNWSLETREAPMLLNESTIIPVAK